ncbi:Neuralized [Dictyocaulus viviparus]|uniref:Neuralized n=1 Tax=Dictyocaulus viviparus TaxID=29172 RepID=A0A0D8YAN6_DICVI|nr:Neuralized [Dictyocaulus viviparus]
MDALESTKSDGFLNSPVLFHPFHGENIELLEHRRRALRRVSFEKGVVFSERALMEKECFFISIEDVEGGWSGHLRIGLTTIDPDTRPSVRNLDSHSWLFSISPFIIPFQNTVSARSLPTEKGSLIGVYYESSIGSPRIHVVLNGFDICPSFADVPTNQQFYAVVDVFGSTKEVLCPFFIVAIVRVVFPGPRMPSRLYTLCSDRLRSLCNERKCSLSNLPTPLRCQLEKEWNNDSRDVCFDWKEVR